MHKFRSNPNVPLPILRSNAPAISSASSRLAWSEREREGGRERVGERERERERERVRE
jgi:hypothetical protein